MREREILIGMVARRLFVKSDDVRIVESRRNNGAMRTGVIVEGMLDGTNAYPVVYIDDVLDEWNSRRIDDDCAASEIANRCLEATKEAAFMGDIQCDRKYILEHAFIQVVNADMNRERLSTMPHRLLADLAMICKIDFWPIVHRRSTAVVQYALIDSNSISIDELFDAAIANTLAKKKYVCMGMSQLFGMPASADELMYVIRAESENENEDCASVLAFPEMVGDFITSVCPAGKKAYILPSSIHEVLIVLVDSDQDPRALKGIVNDVNGTLEPEIVLSDSVYEYCDGEIRVAA